jgi:outer membrane protein assembly factor BamB
MTYSRREVLAAAAGAVVAAWSRCADAADPLWTLRGGVDAWTLFDGRIVAVGSTIRVIDPETGRERQAARLNKPSNSEGPATLAATPAGIVFGWFIWQDEVRVVCVDPSSLKVRWERRFRVAELEREGLPRVFALPRADGVFLKISDKRGDNLFRLRPETGEIVWRRSVVDFISRGPLVSHSQRLVIHARKRFDSFSTLQAIDPMSGGTVWELRLEGASHALGDTTLIVGDRAYTTSNVYPGDSNGRIHVIDLSAGALAHSLTVPHVGEPFAYQDGILYTAGNPAAAWALSTGRPTWRTELTQPGRVVYIMAATLDVRRNRIYLGESNHSFYVLSAADGSVIDTVDVRRGHTDKNVMTRYGAYGFHLHGDRLLVDVAPEAIMAFDTRSL